VKTNVNYV